MLIRLRRDTDANWTAVNPILQAGEPSFDLTSGVLKIGDGTTRWLSLPSIGSGGSSALSLPGSIDPPISYRQPINAGKYVLIAMATGFIWLMPLVLGSASARTLAQLSVEVRSAAGAGGLLGCSLLAAGTGRIPTTEIQYFGTVASDTTGVKSWAPNLSITPNTLYWVGIEATVSAPSVSGVDTYSPYVAANVDLAGTTAVGAYISNQALPLGASPFVYTDVDQPIRVTAKFST